MLRWREAMSEALYGERGFFVGPQTAPAAHFRTSAHASPLLAGALLTLLDRLDAALGRPDPLDLVDIGAGRGELLAALLHGAPATLQRRLRPTAVELAPPPPDPGRVRWLPALPTEVTGLLVATEWLDNVPVDVAQVGPDGTVRYVLVEPATGTELLGEPVTGDDAAWLDRWWPLAEHGTRAEIGRSRDHAWAGAVATLRRGAALAVDYGHQTNVRPPFGTLTAFRHGRQVPPVPDGSCDLTAHVAWDAVAHAGQATARSSPAGSLVSQAHALHALGVTGTRPPLALAHRDPGAYLQRLAAASQAGELTDPTGLGGHSWLLQPVRAASPLPPVA